MGGFSCEPHFNLLISLSDHTGGVDGVRLSGQPAIDILACTVSCNLISGGYFVNGYLLCLIHTYCGTCSHKTFWWWVSRRKLIWNIACCLKDSKYILRCAEATTDIIHLTLSFHLSSFTCTCTRTHTQSATRRSDQRNSKPLIQILRMEHATPMEVANHIE